ncbi:hypothetical protein [Hoeflea sp.]
MEKKISAIRDLMDFILHWQAFRSRAEALRDAEGLGPDERALVGWLIELADRVGVEDIGRH